MLLRKNDACVGLGKGGIAPVLQIKDQINVCTKGSAIELVSIVPQDDVIGDDFIDSKEITRCTV